MRGDELQKADRMTNSAIFPHAYKVRAGREHMDPVYKAIFQTNIIFPNALTCTNNEFVTLSVKKVTGLNNLHKTVGADSQKILGIDVSYLQPIPEQTYAEISITFNLNMNKNGDVEILNYFRRWANMGYNMLNGERGMKNTNSGLSAYGYSDGAAITIKQATRSGWIWRESTFRDILITEVTANDDLDYTEKGVVDLEVKFRADWWTDFTGDDHYHGDSGNLLKEDEI